MSNVCKWCGREATYYFKLKSEWCCSKYPQQCPEFKKKLSIAKLGTKRTKESIIKQSVSMKGKKAKPEYKKIDYYHLCDYGCGNQGRYIFKNKKVCCEIDYRKCKGFITNKKIKKKLTPKGIIFENINSILCSYGCGKIARYKFKNGNYSCSEYPGQCINMKRKLSIKQKEHLRKINTKPLEYWRRSYPLFFKIETPTQTIGGELLVRCKHCKKLFTPTYTQLYERIRDIENDNGGCDYFYCSNKCKTECSVYASKSSLIIKDKNYTPSEYQTFRKFVLERDNYICQYCGEKAEHIHHERPQKLEPFFALDPDLAWSVCKKCHYKYGHKDECSTGQLATKMC